MKCFAADLHVHTSLSPCAAREMTPPGIVAAARERQLAMLAICDHNSAGNVAAVQEAARGMPVVIAGIEITTTEEVHVVGLFPDLASASSVSDEVGATLPEAPRQQRHATGGEDEQLLLDAYGRVCGREKRLLVAASQLALGETVRLIHSYGGLAIAAHANRPTFSVISQLGMFPGDVQFDAVELFVPAGRRTPGAVALRGLPDVPVLVTSDSHSLSEIGRVVSRLEMRAATFNELQLALRGCDGRKCHYA